MVRRSSWGGGMASWVAAASTGWTAGVHLCLGVAMRGSSISDDISFTVAYTGCECWQGRASAGLGISWCWAREVIRGLSCGY